MPTPEPKKIYQLVTETGVGEEPTEVVFGDSTDPNEPLYSDWDLDGNGSIRHIDREDARLQSILKCIFTERQESGYGSNIYDFIGVKDIGARRLSIFMDINFAVMGLKRIYDSITTAQNLSDVDKIKTLRSISVSEDENNPTQVNVSLTIEGSDGNLTDVGVLG